MNSINTHSKRWIFIKIDELLNTFHNEFIIACRSFYGLINIKNVASTDKEIRLALKRNTISWGIILHSLQITFFVTLGRIFDKDPKSFSVYTLIDTCIDNINQFSKEKLRERKRKEWDKDNLSWVDEYIENSYEPSKDDFLIIKEEISKNKVIYENNYKKIRHKIFAHKDLKYIKNTDILFNKTNIKEIECLLLFLYQVERIIWHLFNNGNYIKIEDLNFYEDNRVKEDVEKLLAKLS